MAKKKAAPKASADERAIFQSFAKALTAFMTGEGKGPADPVSLDDVIHAAQFGGAAPDAT